MKMKTLIALVSVMAMLVSQNARSEPAQPANGNGHDIFKCKNETGAYVYQGTPCPKSYSTLSSWKAEVAEAAQKPLAPTSNGPTSFTIQLSPGGAYTTQGSANSVPLVFQVDTGANYVVIPQAIATQARMPCKLQSRAQTANGVTSDCVSVIERMTFGIFTLENVTALIVPNLKQPLLGMNVLKLFRVEHEEGLMKISYKKL